MGGAFESLLLHQYGLGQNVGRKGLLAYGVVDEGFRLRVARGRRVGADALEEVGEHLAFFGAHRGLPSGHRARAAAYGLTTRPFQDGASGIFASHRRLYSNASFA